MARPTMSKVISTQQFGRGMRTHEDKEFLMVFDFVDNANMFNCPYSLHRLLNVSEYVPGGMVLGTKHSMQWDRDMFKKGEKPAVLVDFPISVMDYEVIDIFNWQDKASQMYSEMELLIIAALCLSLTACGTDSIPAQQPTDQVTEQTVPNASVCKATVTEINGNTMLVKPVDGSWELSSADQFSLSASLLDEGVTPTVSMTLVITYDGGVMETYPAQFGNVQKVTVIFALSITPPADKGTLMNDLDYEISKGDSYNSQYKERGYCIDVIGGKYRYTICSGECHTGGYGIKITRLDCLDCGTVIVTVEETAPSQDETVTEAFTYPNCAITFSHERLTES